MSLINPQVTNEAVIPVIESDLFQGNPDSKFAIGILAVGDIVEPGLDNEYAGYFTLRRKVYVEQTGQLHESEIAEDGTDRDEDDKRSVAFGIIENRGVDQRVVAATRLIIKGFNGSEKNGRPLPVEEFCSEIFDAVPAPKGSIEVSRLIARHEKASIQNLLQWKLYSVTSAYTANNNLGPAYAVIEPWLERHFNGTIPVSRIGEPRFVEHYHDVNLPIEIDTRRFIEVIEELHPGTMDEMLCLGGAMSYFGKLAHRCDPGLGKKMAETAA